jgi:anti-anti-sigma factor
MTDEPTVTMEERSSSQAAPSCAALRGHPQAVLTPRSDCSRPETPMTSVGATSRRTGSRSEAGRPAARIIVRLRGALDVAAAPALRERLIGLLHPGMRLLVLDLSRVPSCDPAGLAVLIGTQRRARPLGILVRLAAPSLPVAKLLRLTGLDRSFTICPDLRCAGAPRGHGRRAGEPAREGSGRSSSPSPQATRFRKKFASLLVRV